MAEITTTTERWALESAKSTLASLTRFTDWMSEKEARDLNATRGLIESALEVPLQPIHKHAHDLLKALMTYHNAAMAGRDPDKAMMEQAKEAIAKATGK